MNQPETPQMPSNRASTPRQSSTDPVFVAWATLVTLWFTFGLSTLLNRLALESVNRDTDRLLSDFPPEIGDSIWIVLGIWVAVYLSGLLVGLRGATIHTPSLILSSLLGYTLAAFARLIILDVFPIGPRDAFSEAWSVVTLSGIPGYWNFVFLTLFVGQFFGGIAIYTGQVIAREVPQLRAPEIIDPKIAIAALILPVAFLITGWGLVILMDETARASLETSRFVQFELPYLNDFLQPFAHLVVAILAGLTLGQTPRLINIRSTVVSAAIGMTGYVMLIFLSKDMLLLYAPETFEDPLNLVLPNVLQFILLWWGPVLMVAAATGMVISIRGIISGIPAEPTTKPTNAST